MPILKPPHLRRGDLIGLIAPASPPAADNIERGVRYLESLGYRVTVGPNTGRELGYLAGTDEERAHDLNLMLRDRKVRAIFAIRGGYGTPRLLSAIDYRAVRKDPKVIAGYSDITALQLALFRRTGLVTFSGPMAGVEMANGIDPFTEEWFWRSVTSTAPLGLLKNPPGEPLWSSGKGSGRGQLLGGNLALLVSLLGTPYSPDYRKAVLVLEDVDEAPHRVDRMFIQLELAGIPGKISALVLGKFTDCVPADPSKPHLTIEQVLEEVRRRVRVPVLANFQYGHIARKLTLPFGVRVAIDARRGVFEVKEPGVR